MATPSKNTIAEAEYGAIEDALQSTEKGRRFLRTYAERNRSLETRRLLRSISRLHRAALGEPGLNAEICRDLSSVLRGVSRHRQTALRCGDQPSRLATLENSLEEVEACLISLIESIEERAFETLEGRAIAASPFEDMKELFPAGRSAQLFGELSSYFSNDPR
jgi:hypothetical protein